MAKKMRGWPIIRTTRTEVMPVTAPTERRAAAQPLLTYSRAKAKGAGSLSSLG
ncbi:hypothetical protein D3C72_2534390 [compost metagenome]